MNINATILGQVLTFFIFLWINQKFIWPKILIILNEREHKISQGLQAAELSQKKLQQVELISKQQELETRKYCNALIAEAKKQSQQILDQQIVQAKHKAEEILNNAYADLAKEKSKLEQNLYKTLSSLVIKATENIMMNYLNKEMHDKILQDINNQIYDK